MFRFIAKKCLYFLDNVVKIKESSQPAVLESLSTEASTISKSLPSPELHRTELTLLDLYSGCGGMSTGLCLGAKLSSVNLVAVIIHEIHICTEVICISQITLYVIVIH